MNPSFIYSMKANQLIGDSGLVGPAGALISVFNEIRDAYVAAGQGLAIDKLYDLDLADAGFAKTAAIALTFTGTTPITIDFTALAAATGVQVQGAPSFATVNRVNFLNPAGGSSCQIAPGASNPARTPFNGSSPVHTLAAGDDTHWNVAGGLAVDSTHKTLTFTPSAGGMLLIGIAGA